MFYTPNNRFDAIRVIFYTFFTFAPLACALFAPGAWRPSIPRPRKRSRGFRSFRTFHTVLTFWVFLPSLCLAGTYSGGSGTPADPYKISSVTDWQELIATSSDYDKNFILINDIDFGGLNLTPVAPDINTSQIDFQGMAFNGILNGNGHIIRNIIIHQQLIDYMALFGLIGEQGIIRNLHVAGLNIRGQRWTGGLAARNAGTIQNCILTIDLFGSSYVGGLVGENIGGSVILCETTGSVKGYVNIGGVVGINDTGVIEDSYSSASVTCNDGWTAGGVVGWNSGTVIRCIASGTISGKNELGGLVGFCEYGTIDKSSAVGNINSNGQRIGGLVGSNRYGTITNCYALGNVTSILEETANVSIAGGFVGHTQSGSIRSCYSTGNAKGMQQVGGFAGGIYLGEISDCYSHGNAEGTYLVGGFIGTVSDATVNRSWSLGNVAGVSVKGFVGAKTSLAVIQNSFWDTQTSGQTTSAGGTGKTTTQMKTKMTFTGAGWDFVGEASNGTEDVWRMCGDGVDYPRLSWEFSQGGDMDCPDGVGMDDLVYLAGRWMKGTAATIGAADANVDGKVDMGDLGIVSENWGR